MFKRVDKFKVFLVLLLYGITNMNNWEELNKERINKVNEIAKAQVAKEGFDIDSVELIGRSLVYQEEGKIIYRLRYIVEDTYFEALASYNTETEEIVDKQVIVELNYQ